jgi:hypothetical protein
MSRSFYSGSSCPIAVTISSYLYPQPHCIHPPLEFSLGTMPLYPINGRAF